MSTERASATYRSETPIPLSANGFKDRGSDALLRLADAGRTRIQLWYIQNLIQQPAKGRRPWNAGRMIGAKRQAMEDAEAALAAAKRARRLAKATRAHDELCERIAKAVSDAAEVRLLADAKLADEVD